MGGHFWTLIPAWTFLCYFVRFVDGDRGLVQDLGLNALPDVSKINISQTEYVNMMNAFLQLQASSASADSNSIPRLFTFESDRKSGRHRRDDAIRLKFHVQPSGRDLEIENAELRLLAPPLPGQSIVRIKINQVLGARRKRTIQERDVYLSPTLTKWLEFDVSRPVQDWLTGERNLGLELECPSCGAHWRPLEASINALVHPEGARVRRSSPRGVERHRTDCRNSTKPRCCRHSMTVTFKELDMAEMKFIIQPKSYEAGFCKGRCPPNYNHATNHSRIQSMVHKLNSKKTPKVCCAPSKLDHLQILRVNPDDEKKLIIDTWENMKVIECACS